MRQVLLYGFIIRINLGQYSTFGDKEWSGYEKPSIVVSNKSRTFIFIGQWF